MCGLWIDWGPIRVAAKNPRYPQIAPLVVFETIPPKLLNYITESLFFIGKQRRGEASRGAIFEG
jgi:hypothetical protein